MANRNAPNGFVFKGSVYNDNPNPRIRHFTIDTGVSGTIGKNQACKLSISTGHIVPLNGAFGNDSGADNGSGIFVAQKSCVADDVDVPFVAAAGAIFEVQADADWAGTTKALAQAIIGVGHCYDFNNESAVSSDGLLRNLATLDGNSTPADDFYLQVVGWVDEPGNEFGAFQRLLVRFHPKLFARSLDHVELI